MGLIRRGEVRQWTAEPFVPPYPGASYGGSGRGVPSSMAALQSSAVWACVRLVASQVSMMPLKTYRFDAAGFRTPIPDPPLIKRPSASSSTMVWVYQLIVSLMLRGNAYGRIVARDYMGYPTQIELFSPDDVAVAYDAAGRLVYRFKGVEVPAADVFHMRAFPFPGSPVGLSPVQFAAIGINRDKAIQDFSLGYFLDAPHPTAIFSSDQAVNQEQARTLKERLMAAVQGREPLVLGGGLTYSPLSVSPEESQFLLTQQYGVTEIARIYGVPAEKIGGHTGNSMTYQNTESAGIAFLVDTIQFWLTLIEDALAPLMPGQMHARFDPSVLLRTDLHTRLTATAIGIASHQMLPDEARALSDMPPFTDEQKKEADLVPMTVSPSGRPLALPGSAPAGEPTGSVPAAPVATPPVGTKK